MKSPRFLAALAMAAVLTTGATTAHADFNQVGGNATNGQTPMQEAEKFDSNTTSPVDKLKLSAEGDIRVDGEFTKTINNFPTPTQDGRYLRVTMPIKMDFTYNVDTHTMVSAEGVVVNNSVHATNTGNGGSQAVITNEKIKMTLVDFENNTKGTTTMAAPVKFVESVSAANSNNEVLLPFALKLESATGAVTGYSIKNIQEKTTNVGSNLTNGIAPVEIPAGGTLKLKIEKIPGQNLGNKDLITNQTSLTSHNLKLKFEYDGK